MSGAPRDVTGGAAIVAAATAVALTACNPSLPESGSAAALLYEERCTVCHRLYAPGTMTAATWEMMLDRMQGEMRMRGVPPLSDDELRTLRDYLVRHALKPGEANDQS